MVPDNVCIACLGFDSDRIYLPYKKYKCDRLYLIKRSKNDHKNAEYNLTKIRRHISTKSITEVYVEHDLYLRINAVKKIFEAEASNRIFVNISTGSKLDAISCMFACMLFGKAREVTPFYAHPEDTGRPTDENAPYSETKGVERIEEINFLHLELNRPSEDQIEVLKLLGRSGKPLKKKDLILSLSGREFLSDYKLTPDALPKEIRSKETGKYHATNRRIFHDLEGKWQAIDEDASRRARYLSLTENGKLLLRMFAGQIQPEKKSSN